MTTQLNGLCPSIIFIQFLLSALQEVPNKYIVADVAAAAVVAVVVVVD